MNVDKYLDRIYDESKYNCAHFVCEVWKDLFNQDISYALNGVLSGPGSRTLHAHSLAIFERLKLPQGHSLALFQQHRRQTHVGIWLKGKILHIGKNGVEWSYLETVCIGFNQVRFYRVKTNCNC